MTENSPLLTLVTGMAHSGTTLLSQLILANSGRVNAGFEGGVLLSRESPRKFYTVSPFYEWFLAKKEAGHWGMKAQELAYACDTDDWETFYRRVMEKCALMQGKEFILDKTPRYIFHLEEVLGKMPGVPLFITVKPLDLLYFSYKKRGVLPEAFRLRLLKAAGSYQAVKDHPMVRLIHHSRLCLQPSDTLSEIFELLNLSPPASWELSISRELQPLHKAYRIEEDRKRANSHFTDEDLAFLAEMTPAYNLLWDIPGT